MIEEEVLDGRGKDLFFEEIGVVTDLIVHHLPSPLNQVTVVRIGTNVPQFDAQPGGVDLRDHADAVRALNQGDLERRRPGPGIASAHLSEVFSQGLATGNVVTILRICASRVTL